ncbi:MAG: alpha/beta hydrolase [Armatimonadota bacterium]
MDLPSKLTSSSAAVDIADCFRREDNHSVIIIGNSYGSIVALRVAALIPDICRAVVLVNPPFRDSLQQSLHIYLSATRSPLLTLQHLIFSTLGVSITCHDMTRDGVALIDRDDSTFCQRYRTSAWKVVQSMHLLLPRLFEVVMTDLHELIERCQAPVLILDSHSRDNDRLTFRNDVTRTCVYTGDHFPLSSDLHRCIKIIETWSQL